MRAPGGAWSLCLAIVALCVAGGDLECQPAQRTLAQARGHAIYARMCAVCHGDSGQGYAADQAPALTNADFLSSVPDAYLTGAIANGRAGTTMSAWGLRRGGPLAAEEIAAVVGFLRGWGSGDSRAPLDERSPSGDAARGEAIYDAVCISCHGARGVGGPYEHVGGPDLLAGATDGFLRRAIAIGHRGTRMPGFARTIGEAGVEDVVAVLRSWQPRGPLPTPPARAAPLPLPPLPVHPRGPAPAGFRVYPALTSVDTVHAALEQGARLAVLDARAPSDYLSEHIAGAASVPFYDPDRFFAGLPKDAWLVCYCACPHAESGQLAAKLLAKGFTQVTVLDEGFGVWKSRHYPTRSGSEP